MRERVSVRERVTDPVTDKKEREREREKEKGIYVRIYIYIERERERERDTYRESTCVLYIFMIVTYGVRSVLATSCNGALCLANNYHLGTYVRTYLGTGNIGTYVPIYDYVPTYIGTYSGT